MQIDISKNRIFFCHRLWKFISIFVFWRKLFLHVFFFKEALPLSLRMRVKIFSQLMASVRALLILGVLIFAKSSTFVSSNISLVRFQMLLIMTRRIQYTVSKNKIYLPLATAFDASNRWLLFFCSHRSKFFFLI